MEGLSVSQAAAEEKTAQIDAREERAQSPTFLGVPTSLQVGGPTSDRLYAETRRRNSRGRSSMNKAELKRTLGR